MANPRDAEYKITAKDESESGTRSAERALSRLERKANDVARSTERTADATGSLNTRLRQAGGGALRTAVTLGRLAATVGAVAAISVPAVSGIGALAAGVLHLAATMGPAAASMLPVIAGLALIKGTLIATGPAFTKALSPVAKAFADVQGPVGAIATRGLPRLAREFVRVNMPAIRTGMEDIALSTNHVVTAVGKWINSVTGQRAISAAIENVTGAVSELAPDIANLAVAFLNLFGRVAGDYRGVDLLATGINRVVVAATKFMNSLTTERIDAAWASISIFTDKIKAAIHVVLDIGRWLERSGASTKAFSDAIAAASVVIGIMTGGVLPVIIGLLTLLINHWDEVKAAVSQAVGSFQNAISSGGNLSGVMSVLRGAVADLHSWFDGKLLPAFQRAGAAIMPTLRQGVELVTRTLNQNKDGVQKVQAIMTALGIVITEALIPALTLVAQILIGTVAAALSVVITVVNRVVLPGIRIMARVFLDQLGMIVHAASASFGWIPGIGPKLKSAAADFDRFRDQVNGALSGIKDKSVKVTVHYNSTGTPIASGPGAINPPGKSIAFSDGRGFQFAEMGVARTGGPATITVPAPEVFTSTSVYLDGQPLRAMIREEVHRAQDAAAHKARLGRR